MPKQIPQTQNKTEWDRLFERFNEIISNNSLSFDGFTRAFGRAYTSIPQIQNNRIKGISALPEEYTKEQIGEFLRKPYESEKPLRKTSQILKWTSYPFFKIIKTYADIPLFCNYFQPLYVDNEDFSKPEFLREARLIDKFIKEFRPEQLGHEAVGLALTLGKVFYTYRYAIDKSHNNVKYAIWQQLPSEWLYIVGKNNVSGWTVSFNMMYFLQPGTDVWDFGERGNNIFEPFLDDFSNAFSETDGRDYYNKNSCDYFDINGKTYYFNSARVNKNGKGNPHVYRENNSWYYYVTLPADKVFGFEIDDTTPNVASPLSGLMLTYAQQSDYEDVQLSLLIQPLIKIFTGEIPYFNDNGSTKSDNYKLTPDGRAYFEYLFNELMNSHNTGGTAMYFAPVENIKSHDFTESSNANKISETFNRYGMEKAGLSGLLPVTDDVKASQVKTSTDIESRYSTSVIYPQLERMMNIIFESMGLKYTWIFKVLGTIFDKDDIRLAAKESLASGDISQYFVLAALDGQSWLDKMTAMQTIKNSKFLDLLTPPETSYTQSGKQKSTKITDEEEKAIDMGVTDE